MIDKTSQVIPENMSQKVFDTLLELKDIHFPKASMFPIAVGWYIIITLLILVFVIWFYKKFLCYQGRKGRAKKIALKKLEKLFKKHSQDDDITVFASELSILLKRVSRVSFGKKQVSTLYGEKWQEFILQKSLKNFSNYELVSIIVFAGYRKPKKDDKTSNYIVALNKFVKKWIEAL